METPTTVSLGANLDYMVQAIRPAVAAVASTPEAMRLRAAILQNVEDTINTLLDDSPILRHLAEDGSVALVGAYYELSTGRVHFSQIALVSPAPAGSSAHP
jgi:carbonic anhydrase